MAASHELKLIPLLYNSNMSLNVRHVGCSAPSGGEIFLKISHCAFCSMSMVDYCHLQSST